MDTYLRGRAVKAPKSACFSRFGMGRWHIRSDSNTRDEQHGWPRYAAPRHARSLHRPLAHQPHSSRARSTQAKVLVARASVLARASGPARVSDLARALARHIITTTTTIEEEHRLWALP